MRCKSDRTVVPEGANAGPRSSLGFARCQRASQIHASWASIVLPRRGDELGEGFARWRRDSGPDAQHGICRLKGTWPPPPEAPAGALP
jgi:hypothetical protein